MSAPLSPSRVTLHEKHTAPDACRPMLEQIEKGRGKVPNIFKAMANSPAALKAYMGLSGALKDSALSPRLREAIALAVTQEVECCYCISAHALAGKALGMTPDDIQNARDGKAADAKDQAALDMALAMIRQSGNVSDEAFDAARRAGLSEGEIIDVGVVVALNLFTSYFNHLVRTPLDFPPAPNLPCA